MPETQASGTRTDILRVIVGTKRDEIAALEPRRAELRDLAGDLAPARGFRAALAAGASVAVIAEAKRRSPGAGDIRPDLDPARLARSYQDAGARAMSVLTDRTYFGGTLSDLSTVRAAVELPLLRKDFTLDAVQIDEARVAGADAVLLIVRILDDGRLADLAGRAREIGLDALVEVHDASELERALAAGADLVGINNRDLSTFRTDLAVTERLISELPPDVTVVSESGIRTGSDVDRVGAAGADAVLVGESVLRADDPAAKVRELAGRPRGRRG